MYLTLCNSFLYNLTFFAQEVFDCRHTVILSQGLTGFVDHGLIEYFPGEETLVRMKILFNHRLRETLSSQLCTDSVRNVAVKLILSAAYALLHIR